MELNKKMSEATNVGISPACLCICFCLIFTEKRHVDLLDNGSGGAAV